MSTALSESEKEQQLQCDSIMTLRSDLSTSPVISPASAGPAQTRSSYLFARCKERITSSVQTSLRRAALAGVFALSLSESGVVAAAVPPATEPPPVAAASGEAGSGGAPGTWPLAARFAVSAAASASESRWTSARRAARSSSSTCRARRGSASRQRSSSTHSASPRLGCRAARWR